MSAKLRKTKSITQMTGAQYHKIAMTRLRDAVVLFDHERYMGALYLGGYVVEMTLKWAIGEKRGQRKKAIDLDFAKMGHDFDWLLSETEWPKKLQHEIQMLAIWSDLLQWTVHWRYQMTCQRISRNDQT